MARATAVAGFDLVVAFVDQDVTGYLRHDFLLKLALPAGFEPASTQV